MRLLVDRCVAVRVVAELRRDGHDVSSLIERGLNPPDSLILALALSERRIVLTEDADFGAHVFRDLQPSAGVIRLQQTNAAEQTEFARRALSFHGEALAAGAFVTVRRGRLRLNWPERP